MSQKYTNIHDFIVLREALCRENIDIENIAVVISKRQAVKLISSIPQAGTGLTNNRYLPDDIPSVDSILEGKMYGIKVIVNDNKDM